MKTLVRLVTLILLLAGWAIAALSIHVVRVPDPADPAKSKLAVVPKDRLGVQDTYVDARSWTQADLSAHQDVVVRIIRAGKAGLLGYTVNATGPEDAKVKLLEILSAGKKDN